MRLVTASSATQPAESLFPSAEIAGRKLRRTLRSGWSSRHWHLRRHVKGESLDPGVVVPGNDVGISPGAVHERRIHSKGCRVDQHLLTVRLTDVKSKCAQRFLEVVFRHVRR